MQAEIQTKVKISVSEIKKILAEKFCLYHDFELELVEDFVVESEAVEQDNEGWIDVPNDWKSCRCPTDYPSGTILELLFRSGRKGNDTCDCYTSFWYQDGAADDIVKYRVSK